MSESGRQRVATAAQCAQVRRLAAGGGSLRQIAEDVFGDRRFRGRVERILQEPEIEQSPPHGGPVAEEAVRAETVPTVREALRRYLARVARGHIEPSVGEMVKLLDLERRLQAFEAIEEINALTRSFDAPIDA